MTTRISTALRNFLAQGGSYAKAFQHGRLEIYSGSQPANADSAAIGTLLCLVTANSGAHTAEVRATGTITIAGSAGSVDTVTLDGYSIIDAAVPWNTSTTQTAADLATAINRSLSAIDCYATSSGAVVTVYAPRGMGAAANALDLATTVTTLTATPVDLASGVTPVNGLKFDVADGGVVGKLASQVWSGLNLDSGTAGWFRMYAALADSGIADSDLVYLREDGAISTSGSQLNMTSTTLTAAATTTIDSWSRSFPAA
jgi:hypothetical protein